MDRAKFSAILLTGALSYACVRTTLSAEAVSGDFSLEQAEYCVGEPILIRFSVTNGSQNDFSFFVGCDYRGTLRHRRFSFSVADSAGRNFTSESRACYGGVGTTIVLKPQETYVCYQLLTPWVHLLPPGSYRVQCETELTLGPRGSLAKSNARSLPVAVAKELSFRVVPYDRPRIVKAISRMKETRKIPAKFKRFSVDKPVGWALTDLSNKFQMGVPWTVRGDEREKAVLSGLPARWDDAYSLEYALSSNRNWLTSRAPEGFSLTFSVRNNSNKTVLHRLETSSLSINGVDVKQWPQERKSMLHEHGTRAWHRKRSRAGRNAGAVQESQPLPDR